MIRPAIATMDFATGRRVREVSLLTGLWLAVVAFFTAPLVQPDPTLPALDVYVLSGSEVADADALCGVCAILRCDAPARADCESCARGAA